MSIVLSESYVITSCIDTVSLSGILHGGSDDVVRRIARGNFCPAADGEVPEERCGAFLRWREGCKIAGS